MINPTFCDTITLYHRQSSGKQWNRITVKECFFGTETGEVLSGSNLKNKDSYIVRIPETETEVTSGDIIVKGEAEDVIEDVPGKRPSDLIARYKPDCFTVSGVKYNTKLRLGSHIRITGE